MSRIEKLEAEIADYEKELEQLKAEIEFLKLSEEKKKSYEEYPRVGKDEIYYSVAILGKGEPRIMKNFDEHKDNIDHTSVDEFRYNNNNYFKNVEEASVMSESIKFLFKLQRLYDIYCPGYEPDWNDDEKVKYCIYFSHKLDSFEFGERTLIEHLSTVYFPTMEIADKICNILNEEYKLNKGNKEN